MAVSVVSCRCEIDGAILFDANCSLMYIMPIQFAESKAIRISEKNFAPPQNNINRDSLHFLVVKIVLVLNFILCEKPTVRY